MEILQIIFIESTYYFTAPILEHRLFIIISHRSTVKIRYSSALVLSATIKSSEADLNVRMPSQDIKVIQLP